MPHNNLRRSFKNCIELSHLLQSDALLQEKKWDGTEEFDVGYSLRTKSLDNKDAIADSFLPPPTPVYYKLGTSKGRLGGLLAVGRDAKDSLGRHSVELRASATVGLRGQAVFGSSDGLE